MKVNNLLYLTEDIIYLKNKKIDKVIQHKINNSIIKYGKIYNDEKFLKEYAKLLQSNHLNNNLFGDTIKVIINSTYTPMDIKYLKFLLEKFNYRKIIFENETKYYDLNKTKAFLNVQNDYILLSYIDIYNKTKTFFITDDFFSNINSLLKYIKNKIAMKDLLIIGKGKKISIILEKFENIHHNKTYVYTDSELYLFK